MNGTVLVVDDLERPRRALANELTDAGYDVVQAADGEEGWQRFCLAEPDVVVTDMVMPRADGLELLSRIRTRSDVPVILFTAYGTVQSAASAFKAGADDFVASTDVEIDDLVALVSRAVRGGRGGETLEDVLVGQSRPITRLRERVAGIAPLSTPVLLCGEIGTGRNAVAAALHEFGSTAQGPMVRLMAAAMKPGDRIPDCAFLYLDGVEDIAPRVESFLAEWIARCEDDEFRFGPRLVVSHLGSSSTVRDGAGPLRTNLTRFAVDLPPLRSVADDIGPIADRLVERFGRVMGRHVRLSPSATEFLESQPWPGNVAQLNRVLERAVVFTNGRLVRRETVRELLQETEESLDSLREANERIERERLLRTLRETNANVSRTAELLGKSRTAVYRLIEKNGIPISRRR